MQTVAIAPSERTFEDVCRAARVAEQMGQIPLTLEEQATLYAIKVHAYHSLSALVQKALAMLDELSGDADIELNGDEDEDDDPAGGNVDDEPHDPEEDRCAAGDDMVLSGPVVHAAEVSCGLHEIGSEEDHEPPTAGHWLDHPPELHVGARPGWNVPDAENDR